MGRALSGAPGSGGGAIPGARRAAGSAGRRPRPRGSAPPGACGAAAFLFLLAGGLPLAVVAARSVLVDGRLSLDRHAALLADPRTWHLLGNSLLLAGLATAGAVLAGVPLAVLLGRTDLPFRGAFLGVFVLPLLLPPPVTAVAWRDLFLPRGPVARVLGAGVAARGDDFLAGLPGSAFLHAIIFLPVVIVVGAAALRAVDPRLEEAARLSTGWTGVLLRVSLPLARPGFLAAGLVVFLFSLGEVTVPFLLRFPVFPAESFTRFTARYDVAGAAAAAAPLLLVVLPAVVAERWFARSGALASRPGTDRRSRRIPLGRARLPVAGVVALLAALVAGAPVAGLAATASSPSAFRAALVHGGGSLLRSLAWGAAGATLLLVGGALLALCLEAGRHAAALLDGAATALFVLPGTVIGVGLVVAWNRPWAGAVRGTAAILLLGYLARYLAVPAWITGAALARVPRSLDEAARVAGAGPWRRALAVRLPLAGRGLAAAWLLAYVFCLRETTVSMLAYPPGNDPVTVRLFTLMANGDPAMVAALCLLAAALVLPPLFGLGLLARGETWP